MENDKTITISTGQTIKLNGIKKVKYTVESNRNDLEVYYSNGAVYACFDTPQEVEEAYKIILEEKKKLYS